MIENQSLTVEEARALYFDADALLEPALKLYRLNNHSGGRHYYRFLPSGDIKFYVSVTNLIHQTMPTSPHLIKWIASMGAEEAEEYKNERAGYGTFMHQKFEHLLIYRTLDLDAMEEELRLYCIENGYERRYDSWLHEMKKDVLGFAQFIIDYKVEPLAIEIMLCSDTYGFAGALDLVCRMTVSEKGFFGETYKSGVNKGQPKESKIDTQITAIIDFKSGRKGFYESHEVQLEAYKKMFEEWYPEQPIDRVYNYGPSDWRTAPAYKLTDQTDSKNRAKLEHLCKIAEIEAMKREKTITVLQGVIDIANNPGFVGNVGIVTLENYVTNKTIKYNAERKN